MVVEHIEKHWCPTVTSGDFVGGGEFRFRADTRPHLAIVAAEDEYKTEDTLRTFAAEHLGQGYRVSFVFADAMDKTRLPGVDVLARADAVLLSVRRKPLVTADLDVVRRFVAAGKPVVAIRTTSHAFAAAPGAEVPAGVATWADFDEQILGCKYTGHFPKTVPTVVTRVGRHAVTTDWPAEPATFRSWLYKSNPLATDVVTVLNGTAGTNPPEPVAWVREKSTTRGRVAYTCLGHTEDFRTPAFPRLLRRMIDWAVDPR
jgi:hypothetical protein